MERRTHHRRLQRKERLTTRLLLHISVWALGLVALVSAVTFYFVYQDAKQQFIAELKNNVAHKIDRNQRFFTRVEAFGRVLSEKFLLHYGLLSSPGSERYQKALAQFDAWYEETSPGVLRLKADFHTGLLTEERWFEYLSAFIGPRQTPLTDELKVRVIAAQYALQELAPAWQHVVTNSHFSLPENIIVLYSPDHPWGLLADKDLVITDYSVVRSTLKSDNPERLPNWTGLYYDISAGFWTITYQQPVDLDEQHLVTTSFDVSINQLLSDLTARQYADAEHLVLNRRGDLISASNIAFDLVQAQSLLTPETYSDPLYLEINQALSKQEWNDPTAVFFNLVDDHVVIIERIENPAWWYVTVYPYANIQRDAIVLPARLTIGGVVLVLLIILVVYVLIRRDVSEPLTEMAKVASLMDAKNYKDVLLDNSGTSLKGEVRYAANAFVTMAKRFVNAQEELEHIVKQRTSELASANKKLEALVNVDGLTELLNRRSFDRDMQLAMQPDSEPMVLALGDLDSFKPYNDNYGHEAGDKALQKIADYLKKHSEQGKVYRYGGEELAVILPKSLLVKQPDYVDQLRKGVFELGIEHRFGAAGLGVLTISFGVAEIQQHGDSADAIREADKQLYRAKRQGGNCTLSA